MQPSGAMSKAAPAVPTAPAFTKAPGPAPGGLAFPLGEDLPSAPPAPAFFGPLGGNLSKLAGFPLDMPPGPPPDISGVPWESPPGPPEDPRLMEVPPAGFPPGMGPSAEPSELPERLKDLPPGVAKAPGGSPPRERKRRKGVEGLASNKAIKHGGAVTIYSGYDAAVKVPTKAEPAEKTVQEKYAGGVTQGFQRQLPPGWEMRKSRSTGKVYYVNEKLGKSQFEPPLGSTVDKQEKKKKTLTRTKEVPEARVTDRSGMMGMMRASEQRRGRWAKWQTCNQILNEPDPEEAHMDAVPMWKGKGKGKGRRRDDDLD